MVAVDGFAVFAKTVVLARHAARARCSSSSYLKREHLEGPEYFALMLCSATGMMLMTSANDLITVFLSLEILSIALYVLAAFDRRRRHVAGSRAQVLPAGLVLVGGVPLRRRARLRRDREPRTSPASPISSRPPRLLARRRAAPRASRSCSSVSASRSRPRRSTCGRPTCTRARPRRSPRSWPRRRRPPRSRRVLRVLVGVVLPLPRRLAPDRLGARRAVAARRAASPRVVQTDVKRMLAYSSITHAGFVLIAVQAGDREGNERRAVLRAHVRGDDDRRVRGRRRARAQGRRRARARPTIAGSRAASRCSPGCSRLFLLAQAGVPLTGGFVAKLSVFSAAIDVGQWLARARSACSRRSSRAFVYLRIVLTMYAPADDEEQPAPASRALVDFGTRTALTARRRSPCSSSAIVPWGMLDFAKHATQLLALRRVSSHDDGDLRTPAAQAEAAASARPGSRADRRPGRAPRRRARTPRR